MTYRYTYNGMRFAELELVTDSRQASRKTRREKRSGARDVINTSDIATYTPDGSSDQDEPGE